MKTQKVYDGIPLLLAVILLWLCSGSLKIFAQDSTDMNSGKKETVIVKMKKNVNGKSMIIDTTFSITSPAGEEALEKYLKKYEADLDALEDRMKDFDFALSFSDSLDADSLKSLTDRIRKEMRVLRFHWPRHPGSFKFDYDIPCPENFEFDFPEPNDVMRHFSPDTDVRTFRFERQEGSLSDIIGDIPLDRVKSYSIKETKKGKKIVIEVEDGSDKKRRGF